jgi:hypothetical protein
VLRPGAVEQLAPAHDVRPAAQQCAALALGHAAPHPELDAVVERVGQALGAHRAAHADGLGPVLRRAGHEQLVGVGVAARRRGDPRLRLGGAFGEQNGHGRSSTSVAGHEGRVRCSSP